MDNITKKQVKELNKIATIMYDETSKKKGYFPDGKKFKRSDIIKMIKQPRIVATTFKSVLKTSKVIKKHNPKVENKTNISKEDFNKLQHLINNELEMDSWGVASLNSIDCFEGMGIPFKNVIVMSKHMDKEQFNAPTLPNMECQMEVLKVYGETGVGALKVTEILRKMKYGAVPNHGLGGNIDYTKAGMQANLGFIGKHGMLITKENGPCNRISVVYTSIENLNEFLNNDADFNWGYDFCKKCLKCYKDCPHDAIYKENIIDENENVTCISNDKCNAGFINYGCGICIAVCPFTKVGYSKIEKGFKKNNAN